MKKFIFLFAIVVALVWSCLPEDDSTWATSFDKAASVTVPANVAFIKDVSEAADLPIGLLGKSEAKDIKSVELLVTFFASGETIDPEADGEELTEVSSYPTTVSITEAQLLSLADKTSVDDLNPGDSWIVKYKVNLTNGTTLTNAIKTNISFTCASDLGGDIDFVTTNITAGDGGNAGACSASISGTISFDDQGGGIYAISDATFGQYDCAWDDNPATGVSLVDICGKLTLIGSDQYGLIYSISIVSNDGTDLVIDWENDFGDSGRTTLTRTDGNEWPLGLSTD
ncbi:MAG TPA: hypothetical protein PLJ60_14920 [Chryseolinea sp.]|nr:hypothetical protein [Chryseolinea sp.]